MKTYLTIIFLLGILSACGSKGGGGGDDGLLKDNNADVTESTGVPASNMARTQYVWELPTCGDDFHNTIYYVEYDNEFYTCSEDEDTWEILGVRNEITETYTISSAGDNFCTQHEVDYCIFSGGLMNVYTNGEIELTASFFYVYDAVTLGGDTDEDSFYDMNTITFTIPKDRSMIFRVGTLISRGNGVRNIYIVYDRDYESVKLYYDTNGNNEVDYDSDEMLEILTLELM